MHSFIIVLIVAVYHGISYWKTSLTQQHKTDAVAVVWNFLSGTISMYLILENIARCRVQYKYSKLFSFYERNLWKRAKNFFKRLSNKSRQFSVGSYCTKYLRMDLVKFVEDSLLKIWSDMVCLSRPYHSKFFEGYLPQTSFTTLQVSEITAKYEKQVKYLSILHEATVPQLIYH